MLVASRGHGCATCRAAEEAAFTEPQAGTANAWALIMMRIAGLVSGVLLVQVVAGLTSQQHACIQSCGGRREVSCGGRREVSCGGRREVSS